MLCRYLFVVKHISDNIMVMYLGVMVEKTSSEELFSRQLHPYTKALLSAIPIAKPNLDRKRIALKGELTSPIEPPKMCRFAPRCPYATERCFQEEPALEEVLPQHFVSCHRVNSHSRQDDQQHGCQQQDLLVFHTKLTHFTI